LRGGQIGPSDGWFGPAENRYSWRWLANHSGVDPQKGVIGRKSFRGSDALFARLDRNKDGAIAPDDFDWSDRSPYVQMSYMTNRLFRKLNTDGSGRVTLHTR
jgi:hypothetical protein